MATVTVTVINAHARRIAIEVTLIDNLAADPQDSKVTVQLNYGAPPYDYELTDRGQGGSIEWTVKATGHPDGGPIALSGLPDGAKLYVGSGR